MLVCESIGLDSVNALDFVAESNFKVLKLDSLLDSKPVLDSAFLLSVRGLLLA
ncbi:hypothetical protein [uncultured Helicobacter sp.]|uniref:hypothetical protein n=1 Tax=uncultured Helicobacter sp. TaxID=175537 RepID=UPI0037525E6F